MSKANAVAGLCCGAWSGGDVDVGGGGGGVLCGDGRTCVGSCGGGGDCCVVAAGKVVVVLVRQCCRACLAQVVKILVLVWLVQVMVMQNVEIRWLEGSCFGLAMERLWWLWGSVGLVVFGRMVSGVGVEVELVVKC